MAQTKAPPKRVTAATLAAVATAGKRDKAALALALLQASLVRLDKRMALLQRVLTKVQSAVWCADLTEDASGDVATIDVADEGGLTLIAPAAPAPTPEDGQLAAREAMSGPQVYWCAAALPGVQKWRPKYRRGTITALDIPNDLANVDLDYDPSSAQHLNINQTQILEDVPVRYMTCHSQAFEVGDRCVVRFIDRDWAQPQVVGFESHPKACDTPDIHLIFWEPAVPVATDATVRQRSTGGFNSSGIINGGGIYHSLGLVLGPGRVMTGFRLDDVSGSVSYQIPAFYDGYPVLRRTQSSNTYSSSIVPLVPADGGCVEQQISISTTLDQRTLRWGNQVFSGGSRVNVNEESIQIWQPPYVSVPNSPGDEIYRINTETFSNYPTASEFDTEAPHPATRSAFGPWAAWSVVASNTLSGVNASSSAYGGTPVFTSAPVRAWTAWSLPEPRKAGPGKPRAEISLMPARATTHTVRAYTSASFAATPLDRYMVDFGYLPYTIDTLKIYSAGKDVAWCWLTDTGGTWVSISAINYKTGVAANVSKPEFFPPTPIPSTYIPPLVVLADTWAVLAKNDELNPYFWVWVYTLNMTAGTLTVSKTITNKPGDLSGEGHVGLLQVTTPSLPAYAYLIGAMRDEVACM